jgi:hypothetical protein
LKNLWVEKRIILKWILKEKGVKMWTRYIWLKIMYNSGLLLSLRLEGVNFGSYDFRHTWWPLKSFLISAVLSRQWVWQAYTECPSSCSAECCTFNRVSCSQSKIITVSVSEEVIMSGQDNPELLQVSDTTLICITYT